MSTFFYLLFGCGLFALVVCVGLMTFVDMVLMMREDDFPSETFWQKVTQFIREH